MKNRGITGKKQFLLVLGVFLICFAVFTYANKPQRFPTAYKIFDSLFLPAGQEAVSQRNYNMKAFATGRGTFKARIFNDRIHFFDGVQWIDLEKIADKEIKKEYLNVKSMPTLGENGFTEFLEAEYQLHPAIKTKLKNNKLHFIDATGKTIKQLTTPYAWDSKGNTTEIYYKPKINGNNLKLFVDVPNQWLKNAKYPIVIDTNSTTYGDLGDGSLICNSTTYHPCDNDADYAPAIAETGPWCGQDYVALCSCCRKAKRLFLSFDTSALSGNTVDGVTFCVWDVAGSGSASRSIEFHVYSGSGNCFGALDNSDISACTTDEGTLFSYSGELSQVDTEHCMVVSVGSVNVDGNSQYKLAVNTDISQSECSADEKMSFYLSDQTGTDRDPYLEIEYSAVVPEFSFIALITAIFITVAFVGLIRKRF